MSFYSLNHVGACWFPGHGVCRDIQLGGSLRRDAAGLVEQYGAFSVLK